MLHLTEMDESVPLEKKWHLHTNVKAEKQRISRIKNMKSLGKCLTMYILPLFMLFFLSLNVNGLRSGSKIKCLCEENLKKELINETNFLNPTLNSSTENYEYLTKCLSEIEIERCRGAAIRCKIQNIVEGEKFTAFFLGLEKQRQNNSVIEELQTADGKKVTHLDEIETHEYYKNLFQSQNVDIAASNRVSSSLKKKINIKQWCEMSFTDKEIEFAIVGLNNNKSPGQDGLTAEFYKEFMNFFIPMLSTLFQSMVQRQTIPEFFAKAC